MFVAGSGAVGMSRRQTSASGSPGGGCRLYPVGHVWPLAPSAPSRPFVPSLPAGPGGPAGPTPSRAGFGPAWTAESLTVQTGELQPVRGLFWHTAPGTTPTDDVWVHYGFTGTGMWISPGQRRWALLLTNKLYYTRDRQPLADVRNAFRGLAFG